MQFCVDNIPYESWLEDERARADHEVEILI
jgi:hypothetical protein